MNRTSVLLGIAAGASIMLALLSWQRLLEQRSVERAADDFAYFPRKSMLSPRGGGDRLISSGAPECEASDVAGIERVHLVETGLQQVPYVRIALPASYYESTSSSLALLPDTALLSWLIGSWTRLDESPDTLYFRADVAHAAGFTPVALRSGTKQLSYRECIFHKTIGATHMAVFSLEAPDHAITHHVAAYHQLDDSTWIRLQGRAPSEALLREHIESVRSFVFP